MSLNWFKGLRRGNPPASDKGPDRRQRYRTEQYFDCTWISVWGEERSRISSLGPTGCYIESRTTPTEGTVVPEIVIHLASGPVTVQGTVISTMRGVGFAVRFSDVTQDADERLSALVQSNAYPVGSAASPFR